MGAQHGPLTLIDVMRGGELVNILESLMATPVESLISRPEWGAINFEGSRKSIENSIYMAKQLLILPIDLIPRDKARDIEAKANALNKVFDKLRGFSVEDVPNPSQTRNDINVSVTAAAEAFYESVHIYIPYLAYQNGEVKENISKITGYLQDAKDNVVSCSEFVEGRKSQIDKVLDAAREASASVGVAHFTADFAEEAKGLDVAAKKWLWATIGLSVFTSASAVFFILSNPSLNSIAESVNYVSSRIILLGFLIGSTLWCGNIYKAVKHQSVVNRFKSNSLRTFQAFVNASDDPDVSNAVLLESARAIFAEGATGYISGKQVSVDQGARIVEVVRSSAQVATAASRAQ